MKTKVKRKETNMSRRRSKTKQNDLSEKAPDCPRTMTPGPIDNLKNFAYTELFAVFALAVSFNNWGGNMWSFHANPSEPAMFTARVALFILLVILMFRWMLATHHEFEMWVEWLEHPFAKQDMYVAILGLPVVGGVLLAFAYDIIIISILMTVYLIVSIWTQWLCNEHFKRAIHKTRQKTFVSETKRSVLQAMEHYWLKRPQLAKILIMTLVSSVAVGLALAGSFHTGPWKDLFQLSAYAVLMLNIVVGELVIASWRHTRDKAIEHAMISVESC